MNDKPGAGAILQYYRDQRWLIGIKEAVAATATRFGMDPKDVCISLGLDPNRYA